MALLTALGLALGVLMTFGTPATAEAALWNPYTRVFSATVPGKIVLRGNGVVTCDPVADTCQRAKRNTARNPDNQANVDRYLDVDNDPSTFNSSTALLPLNPSSRVLFAGLYWGGDARRIAPPANPDRKTVVRLKAPGSSTYTNVTSTRTGQGVSGSTRPYQGFADVTTIVAAAGSGSYTVADIATTLPGGWGGWALIVAYADANEPVRNLNVFNGFGTLTQGNSLAVVADGFVAPKTGRVYADVGVVGWDGERTEYGEQLTSGGKSVTDSYNPADNVFNSSVTTDDKQVLGRVPADVNTFGTDVDRIRVPSGAVTNSSTSNRIRFSSDGDTVHVGPVAFETEVAAADLSATATVSSTEPTEGQTLTYTYRVTNERGDAAKAARLVTSVPLHTRYVAGSLTVNGTKLTDADDKDAAAYTKGVSARGRISVGLGTGATSKAGGAMAVKATTTITFKAKVDTGLGSRTEIAGVASLSALSVANGYRETSVSEVAASTVIKTGAGASRLAARPEAASARAEYFGSIAIDPLRNDVDQLGETDGAGLTVGDVTAGGYGETTVLENTLSYQYEDTFAGLDVITYSVQDGNDGSQAIGFAYLTVINDVPVARPDVASTSEDEAIEIFPLSNDSDPNNDPLTLVSISGLDPKKASAKITGTDASSLDTIALTPVKGYRGTAVFTYVMKDARGSKATASVTVVFD